MKLEALALLLVLSTSCENASKPQDPVWGKQACAHCAMLLSDPHFGAQLTTEGGDRFFFDDPGCMAAHVHDEPIHVRAMWVHEGSRWIDAKTAHFRTGAQSPMDYGFEPDAQGTADWAAVERAAIAREKKM